MAFAQQQMPPIPVDPNVRIGKLDNGLTYYIRHNALPEKQADFYIAQKVGSILEDDNQRGLAHFLEHMCFNGTTHFPDNRTLSQKVLKSRHDNIRFKTIPLQFYRVILNIQIKWHSSPDRHIPHVIDLC